MKSTKNNLFNIVLYEYSKYHENQKYTSSNNFVLKIYWEVLKAVAWPKKVLINTRDNLGQK